MAKLGFTFDPAAHAEPSARETNLSVALGLAEAGIPVFPARVSKGANKWDKTPLVEWRKAATSDPAIVRRWWMQFPDALPGIELAMSELVVIDADRHGGPDGVAALADLAASKGGMPAGPIVETAGGGLHHIFRNLSQDPLGNARGSLPDGIDVRGAGGWIVAPGSVRADGAVYGACAGSPTLLEAIDAGDIPAVPSWLVDIIKTPKEREVTLPAPTSAMSNRPASSAQERAYAEAAMDDECASVAGAFPGTRNDALNRAALKLGHQVAAGRLSRHEVTQALIAAAQASGLAKDDGMPSVLKTIASGINAGMREPAPPLDNTSDRDEAVGAASAAALVRERIDPTTGEIISEPHPAPKGPALRMLPLIVPADLQGQPIPSRRWMVEDLVPERTVTSINGDGGTGKSLLSLQLGVAGAVGGVWLGHRVPRCRVLFVTAEDDADECHRRLWSIVRAEKIELSDLDNLRVSSLVEEPDAVLAAPEQRTRRLQPTALWGALERFVAEWQPKLVILDTLADLFGGDEIDRAQSRAFIGMLRRLCVQQNLTIILLAHPSVSGMSSGSGSSGSTAWNNSVRSRLYLRRAIGGDGIEDDPDLRVLTTKKANYGPVGAEIKMRWVDGRFIADNVDEPQQDPSVAKARVDAMFLKMLDDYEAEGRMVGSARSANYAPTVFAADARAKGIDRRGFEGAMNRLFAEKRIRNVEYGPPSKTRMRLTRARNADVD